MARKISPRLKNQSEIEKERSARRSRFRSDSGLRQFARPSEEDGAERKPDPRVVDLPPERPVVAARHLPGDLRAGPGLRDPNRGVLDARKDDLARLARRPDLHRPEPALRVEAGLLRELLAVVAIDPVCDLPVGERELDRFPLSEGRARVLLRDERRPDHVALRVVDRRGRGRSRGRSGQRKSGRGGSEDTSKNQRRKLQSLLARKFHGITSRIAIAWAGIFGRPRATRTLRAARFAASATLETARNLAPW